MPDGRRQAVLIPTSIDPLRGSIHSAPRESKHMSNSTARQRVSEFCRRFGLRVPILQAPMAGACPPALAIATANAGGMGGCGALMMAPKAIADWAGEVRGR